MRIHREIPTEEAKLDESWAWDSVVGPTLPCCASLSTRPLFFLQWYSA